MFDIKNKYVFFIAGIIQGSRQGKNIHSQSYRDNIKQILEDYFKGSEVFCPFEKHKNSISYDDQKAKRVFLEHIEKVKLSHALVVYLPEASLGTGIEMWEANNKNRVIITISPMSSNWVIRILSDEVFPDIQSFNNYVTSGKFAALLKKRYPKNI